MRLGFHKTRSTDLLLIEEYCSWNTGDMQNKAKPLCKTRVLFSTLLLGLTIHNLLNNTIFTVLCKKKITKLGNICLNDEDTILEVYSKFLFGMNKSIFF